MHLDISHRSRRECFFFDGNSPDFLSAPPAQALYHPDTFLHDEHKLCPPEILQGRHLNFDYTCSEVSANFNINFPGNEVSLGYVYGPLEHEPIKEPMFMSINDPLSFRNYFSIVLNRYIASTLVRPTPPPTIELHIFKPKIDGTDIIPAMRAYLDPSAPAPSVNTTRSPNGALPKKIQNQLPT